MKKLPAELPERLEAELTAEATSASTGGKRKVWTNKEHGITLVVTWSPPYMHIGVQKFTCTALPHWQFNNYEALRKAYAEQVAKK